MCTCAAQCKYVLHGECIITIFIKTSESHESVASWLKSKHLPFKKCDESRLDIKGATKGSAKCLSGNF